MLQATSTLIISAPVERIWDILTNLDLYETWNPFVRRASGRIEEGAVLDVEINSALIGRRRATPRVLKVCKPYGFKWRERLLAPWLLDSELSFVLQVNGPEGRRFVQTATFKGVLAPLAGRLLRPSLRLRQEAMNRALKMRAETCRRRAGTEQSPRIYRRPGMLVANVVRSSRRAEPVGTE